MVRRILLLVHRVPVSGNFTLNDLAGGAGRMDEVARTLSTALTVSNDLRRDVEMTLLFRSEETPTASRRIQVFGARVRYLNPDERSTAALLKNGLVRSAALSQPVESSPGLVVSPTDPDAELERFLQGPHPLWLTESGRPLREVELPAEFSAVLSDPTDPVPAERGILERSGVPRASVGPRPLRSSQVVDLLLNEADLRESTDSKAQRERREGTPASPS